MPRAALSLCIVLLLATVTHANAQQPFKDIVYLAGHDGYPKKLSGHIVLTDTAVVFTKRDKRDTPVFAIPIKSITDVTVSTDRKDASVGSKIVFGFLSRSRKDELVELTTETADGAEGIVFKVGKNQSAGIAAKIRFLMKRVGVVESGSTEVVAGGVGAANVTAAGGTLHSGPGRHFTVDSGASAVAPSSSEHPISSSRTPREPPPPAQVVMPTSDQTEHRLAVAKYDSLPPGMKYVGDGRTKRYYSAGCAAAQDIPPESQYFFGTETGAQAIGFRASADC